MTQFLMCLYTFVMVSGFWGLALQNIIPKILGESLSEEVIYEQIPYLRGQLLIQAQAEAAKLQELAGSEDLMTSKDTSAGAIAVEAAHQQAIASVGRFLEEEALPYLAAKSGRDFRLRQPAVAEELFATLTLQIPEKLRSPLNEICYCCDKRRRFDIQGKLHRWLHGWLLVHAPASILLVVVTLWHAFVAAFTYA